MFTCFHHVFTNIWYLNDVDTIDAQYHVQKKYHAAVVRFTDSSGVVSAGRFPVVPRLEF